MYSLLSQAGAAGLDHKTLSCLRPKLCHSQAMTPKGLENLFGGRKFPVHIQQDLDYDRYVVVVCTRYQSSPVNALRIGMFRFRRSVGTDAVTYLPRHLTRDQ